MRSKNILSIAAFIVAFGFSAFIASLFIPIPQVLPVDYSNRSVSYNKPTSCFMRHKNSTIGDKITVFILRDENNGSNNDEAVTNLDWEDQTTVAAYAESIEEYVDASSSMNAKDFPGDFQAAWRKHMKAWRDYSTFLNKTAANMDDTSREDFYQSDKLYNGEIKRTWDEVLRIGASYGADVR